MTLRGATVDVDSRKATSIVMIAGVVAVTILVATLVVAGVHKNGEIANLRDHGVLVDVTVKECTGQLGGSGSNAAAYRCDGTFEMRGHRYGATIPGGAFRAAGSSVRLVTTTDDPGLIATVQQVRDDHTSWGVFVLPLVLFAIVVAIASIAVNRRRRVTPATPRG